jgi:hypothetical protein
MRTPNAKRYGHLLRPLSRDVETEEARKGGDEEDPAPPVREIAAEIRPDRKEAGGDGD